MSFKSKYNFLNKCHNNIMKLIIDLIPAKHNIPKDLYRYKKIASGFKMNYEKIDACEKYCMLFYKEHKDDTECMHYGRFTYVNVINKDGTLVITKVMVKQFRYIPITIRLKRLFLCEEMVQRMRSHKKGMHDSEDAYIMSHLADVEAWHALDHFDSEFARDPRSVSLGLSMNGFQHYSSDNTTYSCWPNFVMPYNLPPNKYLKEEFILRAIVIPDPKELKKQMNIFCIC
jgi:hypothetical protein